MNLQTVENIIDDLIKDKNKTPRKMLRNRGTLFVDLATLYSIVNLKIMN